MKKITVDAKAFTEAMNKVSRVLKKECAPHTGGDRRQRQGRMLYAGRNRHGHMARSGASGLRR